MLIWRLVLEDCGTDIEYITGETNIVVDALSIFSINRNQVTTQEFIYKKEIVSQINDTEELPEVIFPINLKIIDQYQRKDPILMDKYEIGTY